MKAVRDSINSLNGFVGRSTFGRIFRLDGCGHENMITGTTLTTEIRAGVTTFFTMAYIIAVNATILSDTGGNCVCNDASDRFCANNTEYASCVQGASKLDNHGQILTSK